MKTDKALLAAVAVLIVLVGLLIFFTLQKNHEIARATDTLEKVRLEKPEAIDYQKIESIIEKQVSTQVSAIPIPEDGSNGTNGENGSNGVNGNNGSNGKSVYDLWLEAGNVGTLRDFLASIKGEKGDQGETPKLCYTTDTGVLKSKLTVDVFWQVVPDCEQRNE